MKSKLILAIIAILTAGSWAQQQSELKKMEWLLGTWETKTPKGSLYETWTRKSNFEFQGKSYFLKNKDTLLFETVQLVEKDKKLHYIVSVKKQNGGFPVSFVSKNTSEEKATVFENPLHDFPQAISYKKTGKDSLLAEISGSKHGREMKQQFPMRKIK
ncbi:MULTISPECIES: DUF6265 family protein [Chryseobacterium]|uniref:DUF6265 family protein n=1 Tax=Chryseobacterium TaxID=59732 RepID=UPI00129802D6|nr:MULTISPECIES: DUF6265 family protein [Chryseobacterium]MDR6922673.1 hypothetical protein [Chryseobacterium sp. 2987]